MPLQPFTGAARSVRCRGLAERRQSCSRRYYVFNVSWVRVGARFAVPPASDDVSTFRVGCSCPRHRWLPMPGPRAACKLCRAARSSRRHVAQIKARRKNFRPKSSAGSRAGRTRSRRSSRIWGAQIRSHCNRELCAVGRICAPHGTARGPLSTRRRRSPSD
jgi:hypothetical protein